MSTSEGNMTPVTKRKVLDVVSTLDAAVKQAPPTNRAAKRRRLS